MSEKRRDKKGRILRMGEGQRKDGRYYFRWNTSDGKRCTEYAETLNELRDKEKEIERRQLLGDDAVIDIQPNACNLSAHKQNAVSQNARISVEQLLEKYIESRNDVRTNTRLNYLYCRKIIREDSGNWILTAFADDLKMSDAKRWYGEFYARNHYCKETFSKVKTILRKAFQYGQNEGFLTRNPFQFDFRIDIPSCTRDALTPTQQETLFAYLNSNKRVAQNKDIVIALLETGLRISELCGLIVSDINFDLRALQVRRQMLYRNIGGEYRSYIQTLKTQAGYRTIPLSPSAIQSFRDLIANADLNVEVDGISGFVMARNGFECKASTVQARLRNIGRRIRENNPSFPNVTPHVLRHTFCTNLFRLGVNPKAIQKIMGHTNISTTLDVYTHMEYEAIERQIGELGDSISFNVTSRNGTSHKAGRDEMGRDGNKDADKKEDDAEQITPPRTPFTPFFTPFARRDTESNGGLR